MDEPAGDESRVIAQAQAGDQEAFCVLVRNHLGVVRGFLGRYARSGDQVDDLAQEVFIAAHRSLTTFDGRTSLRSWLLGIARHRALAWLQAEGRRRAHEGVTIEAVLNQAQQLEVASAEHEDQAERRLMALRSCLSALPADQARLVLSHYGESADSEDLAVREGRSAVAIRVALFRVRRALRNCIERQLGSSLGNSGVTHA